VGKSLVVRLVAVLSFVLLGVFCASASAAELKIAFKHELTSADPHVLNGTNRNIWTHVYDSLVAQDENLRPKPGLALSWRAVDQVTWEFKLRPNVKFHNGASFGAEDVKSSIERAMHLNGARTFKNYLRGIEAIVVVNPLTVLVKTKEPVANLPDNVGLIAIIPKSLGAAAEQDFATGKAAIGTGPYKLLEWAHGQRVAVVRNDTYWGEKEPWDKVTFQFIAKEPARASALLSGSVDVIDAASASLKDAFGQSKQVETSSITSYMLNYVQVDVQRDDSPFVQGNDGKPLGKNPFKDLRVRKALTLAFDRNGIAKHVMKGDSEVAGQVVPSGFFGYDKNLKAPTQDLAKAKALLAEAGYPNGFRLTLHCSNDRHLNDAKVCEALGQTLAQLGIKTDVRTMPFAIFQPRAISGASNGDPEFSMWMHGIGAVTGDSLSSLGAVVHTFDKKLGMGANNYGRYSNKEIDALLDKASGVMNEQEREDLQKAAAKLAVEDVGVIPIHFVKSAWAYKKGLSFKPRSDGFTYAMNIRPAKNSK